MTTPNDGGPAIAGIPSPTLSQKVAQLEYQRDQLNEMLGELIATCLLNLDRGGLKCDDHTFRRLVETRSNLRMQIMGEYDMFSHNSMLAEREKGQR